MRIAAIKGNAVTNMPSPLLETSTDSHTCRKFLPSDRGSVSDLRAKGTLAKVVRRCSGELFAGEVTESGEEYATDQRDEGVSNGKCHSICAQQGESFLTERGKRGVAAE